MYLQAIHDELVFIDIEGHGTPDKLQVPLPLDYLQKYLIEMKANKDSKAKALDQQLTVKACMRDMYHHARVCRLHILECVMETALSAVKRHQLEEAGNVWV